MKYFKYAKYFGTEIVFCGLCELHFHFADPQVLPDMKLGCRDTTTLPFAIHPSPYVEDVSIVHPRRRHTCSEVNRVVVRRQISEKRLYICMHFECEKFENNLCASYTSAHFTSEYLQT